MRRVGSLELLLRADPLGHEPFLPVPLELRLQHGRLGLADLGLGGLELRLRAVYGRFELVGVELGERLAGGHGAVVIDEDVADDAGELARDLHLVGGLNGAGRGDRDGEIAFGDRLGDVVDAVAGAAGSESKVEKQAGGSENGDERQRTYPPQPRLGLAEPEHGFDVGLHLLGFDLFRLHYLVHSGPTLRPAACPRCHAGNPTKPAPPTQLNLGSICSSAEPPRD